MKPIVVVGSYNTGLTMTVQRLPRDGETLLGSGFTHGPGGKGSNQAIAVRRLGGRAYLVSCVGKDAYGDEAFELWKEEGLSAEYVKRTERHTGLGFVIVDARGSNVITVDPGANLDLSPADVEAAKPVIGASAVLLAQLEVTVETVEAAVRLAKASGSKVVLNPAPARTADSLPLRWVDILTPNEEEFGELAGTSDLEVGSTALLHMGPKAIVVTLGERGAFVATPDDRFTVPAPRVESVDTTGAGDAFNGALAVAVSEGEPLRQAVTFANYAGALATTRRQVVPALPKRDEVDGFRRNDVLE